MDVDNELDSGLLEQFSSMGTTDKEVLITEFQKLLGNQLNPAGCEFFLEMNKWYFFALAPSCGLSMFLLNYHN